MANGLFLQIVGMLARRGAEVATNRKQSIQAKLPDPPPRKDTLRPSHAAPRATNPVPPAVHPVELDTSPEAEDDSEEIRVDVTEDSMVWIHGEEWELVLSPQEARELAETIREAAALAV